MRRYIWIVLFVSGCFWPAKPAVYKVRIEKDLCYLEPNRAEKFDLYSPVVTDANQLFPAVVIIHGGGWWGGDKAKAREQNIGTTLAGNGYVCMSINYLLSKKSEQAQQGSAGWPENLYDCKRAVQFLRKNAKAYQVDPNHIGVIGGSAGGHLAAMVGLTGSEPGLEPNRPYEGISGRVQAVVALYGVFNLLTREANNPAVETFLGVAKEQNRRLWEFASPVNHISSDNPPFLIIHGTADKVVDYRQSIEMDARLREKGVQSEVVLIDGAPHSFDLQPKQRDLRAMVIGFFDKHLKTHDTR
jgi:acetyl esterase/lipase